MSTVVKDLGAVSAYAYAVEKGYTGTEAEFAELMADYAEVGQRAEDAADSALESKTAAQTAATTATNKATEATTAATTATTKAGEASTSASTATSAKDTAVSASQTATTKSTEATTAAATATSAKTDAVAANTAAQSAKTAAQTAQTGAETAAASVQSSAAQIQTNADDISELKEDTTQLKSELSDVTGNTYNLVVGKLSERTVNGNGGIVNWGNTTDMVIAPVSANNTYTISTDDSSGFVGAFYESIPTDSTTASYNGERVVQASKTFIAPIDGYVAFRTSANYAYAQIVLGDTEKEYIYPKTAIDRTARKDISLLTKNKLDGKILCCCGDSITYGADMDSDGITSDSNIPVYQCNAYGIFSEVTSNFLKTWGWQIASRNNMTFYNGGVSGSTVQGILDKYGFSLSGGRYTRLPENIDYLVLWFGWNDTAYGSLGTINDETNQSYYGAYNVVLPYLINKYPYAKIALVVPFGTDAGHRNAIRQLGNKWGVAVWDNYQGGTPLYYGKEDSVGVNASIVTANRAKFQANGAHPNYRGHKQLADMIEEFLRGI